MFFSPRLLNSVASTSGTQDGINDNEANKQQTFSKLKSLLEFYQESKVGVLLCVEFSLKTGCIIVCHLTQPVGLYSFSCMDMWSTLLIACGTAVELCWKTGLQSHPSCCKNLRQTVKVDVFYICVFTQLANSTLVIISLSIGCCYGYLNIFVCSIRLDYLL